MRLGEVAKKVFQILIILTVLLSPLQSLCALTNPFSKQPTAEPGFKEYNGNYTPYWFGYDYIEQNLQGNGAYTSGAVVDTKRALTTSILLSISALHNKNPELLDKSGEILSFFMKEREKQGLYYYYSPFGSSYIGKVPADEGLEKYYLYALAWYCLSYNYLSKLGLVKPAIYTYETQPSNATLLFKEIIYINNTKQTNTTNNTNNSVNVKSIYIATNNELFKEYKNMLTELENAPYIQQLILEYPSSEVKQIQLGDIKELGLFLSLFSDIDTETKINYYPTSLDNLIMNPQYIALAPYFNTPFFTNTTNLDVQNLVYKLTSLSTSSEIYYQIQVKNGSVQDYYKYYVYYTKNEELPESLEDLKYFDRDYLAVLLAVSALCHDIQLTLQNEKEKLDYVINKTYINPPNISVDWEFTYTNKVVDNAYYLSLPPEFYIISQQAPQIYKYLTCYAPSKTFVVMRNGNHLYTFRIVKVYTLESYYTDKPLYIYGFKKGVIYFDTPYGVIPISFKTENPLIPAETVLPVPLCNVYRANIVGTTWGGSVVNETVVNIQEYNDHFTLQLAPLASLNKSNVGDALSYILTYNPNIIYTYDTPKIQQILIHSGFEVTPDEIYQYLNKYIYEDYIQTHQEIAKYLLNHLNELPKLSIPSEYLQKEQFYFNVINHLDRLNKWSYGDDYKKLHRVLYTLIEQPNLDNLKNYFDQLYNINILTNLMKKYATLKANIQLSQEIEKIYNKPEDTPIQIPPQANNTKLITIAETYNSYITTNKYPEKMLIAKKLLTLIPQNTTLAKKLDTEIKQYINELSNKEFLLISQFISNNQKWNQTINKEGVSKILSIEDIKRKLQEKYDYSLYNDLKMIEDASPNTKVVDIAQKVKSKELQDWKNNILQQYNEYLAEMKRLELLKQKELEEREKQQRIIKLTLILLLVTIIVGGIGLYYYRKLKLDYEVVEFIRDKGILKIRVNKNTNKLKIKIPEGWTLNGCEDYIIKEGVFKKGDIISIKLEKKKETTHPLLKNLENNKDMDKEKESESGKKEDDDDFNLPFEGL